MSGHHAETAFEAVEAAFVKGELLFDQGQLAGEVEVGQGLAVFEQGYSRCPAQPPPPPRGRQLLERRLRSAPESP